MTTKVLRVLFRSLFIENKIIHLSERLELEHFYWLVRGHFK